MSAGLVAGAVAAPIIGGMIGNSQAKKDRAAADRYRQMALQLFQGIRTPTPEEQQIVMEQLRSQGQLTPELEQAIMQVGSEMQNVSTDPRLRDAQLAALSKLGDISSQGGMTAEDKARMNQIMSETNRQEKGNRDAIMMDMARRGQSGSGFELVANMMNQQGAADRAAQQGLDVKAQAEKRALEALMNQGNMAGNMRSQEFGEKSRIAEAQDAINRFNTSNRQDVMSRNVGARNQAQAANLANSQRIADTNTGLRNQQQMHNKGLIQQQFQNQMDKAAGMSGQYQGMANASGQAADRSAGMWAGIGQGVGQGFAAVAGNKARPRKNNEEEGF